MITVIPVCIPQIDWTNLILRAADALGRSPTRNIDLARENVGTLRSYLALCDSIGNPDSSFENSIKKPRSSILSHLQFGFLVIADAMTLASFSSQYRELHVTIGDPERCMLVSGNLNEWHSSMLEDTRNLSSQAVMNQILECFDQVGLREIWFGYRKVPITSDVFRLSEI